MRYRDEKGFYLVDHDPNTGSTVWSKTEGTKTVYRTDYPVDHTVKSNKEAQTELRGQRWGDWQRVASVPLNVYYDQIARPQNEGDRKYVSKWLNNSDNAAWRVKEGRV